jgi:two-component system nitrate/nitrite response regulator NarP
MNQSLELSNLPVLVTKSESDVVLLDSASASVLSRQTCDPNARFESERAGVSGSAQLCKVLFDSVARPREFISSVRNIGLRLTRRQQELLPMIARGLTNKEIASFLNLSEQTVKNHIHRMLRKMGANDRLQVTEIAGVEGFAT